MRYVGEKWGHDLCALLPDRYLYAAEWTEAPHETLGHCGRDGRTKNIGINPHIDETGEGASGVVGVQCGEDEVARKRCIDGGRSHFAVADLTDHDDVRVLAQCGAQTFGKRIIF